MPEVAAWEATWRRLVRPTWWMASTMMMAKASVARASIVL